MVQFEELRLHLLSFEDKLAELGEALGLKEMKEEVASLEITVVKIGMSWYVDNTVTDTSVLYNFYK